MVFKSLFVKILMISFIGIAGVMILTFINFYVSTNSSKTISCSRAGNSLIQQVLKIFLLEEKFINESDSNISIQIMMALEKSQENINSIKETNGLPELSNLLSEIDNLNNEHQAVLERLIPEVMSLKTIVLEIGEHFTAGSNHVVRIINLLDEEEAELSLMIEDLPQTEAQLRDQTSQFLGHFQTVVVAVQKLLLNNDGEAFLKDRDVLLAALKEKRINTAAQVGVVNKEKYSEVWQKVEKELETIETLLKSLYNSWHHRQSEKELLMQTNQAMQKKAEQLVNAATASMFDQLKFADSSCIISMFTVGLVLILVGFLIARGITRPVNAITEGMNDGAVQLAAASARIASAGQSMAQGTAAQAAAIEETSSSMKEMASITRSNAENALKADRLMKEAADIVTGTSESISDLTRSINDISKASEDTANIIKTIDEIAFQTNLLALNAAVEAARAGEAGVGFAVVADEVRNLSMRAAGAASNTAELIQAILHKVHQGNAIVAATDNAFTRVSKSTAGVSRLLDEISKLSATQSDGIEQIHAAIDEIDKAVQKNSANAEESASASEEMHTQAEQLKDYVKALVSLISGRK